MTPSINEVHELHWMMGILQHIDVGLVVIDRDYRIRLWNGFMENHSGLAPTDVRERSLFEVAPDLPRDGLKKQIDGVFLLKSQSFSTWQQRPFLFKFGSYRPITGGSEWMYQNITLIPLSGPSGNVDFVCLIVYDVTDMALDEIALQHANVELQRLGQIDGLTGLLNRRAWEQSLDYEFKRHQRTRECGVLVMFDIDHFKKVNDTWGHPAGDEVIRQVAETVNQVKRETDIAGRYGGEEFGVILIDTNIDGAIRFAERLRQAIAETVIHHDGIDMQVTISLGLAEINEEISSHRVWLERTDQALYQAKRGGRNRFNVFHKPVELNAV